MIGVNKVILVGRLGQDPEVFTFENGRKKVRMNLATNEPYRTRDGKWEEHTEWHNLVCFGPMAERVENTLKKGSPIYAEGRIRLRSWEDKGRKQYVTEIEVRRIASLETKKSESPASMKGVEVPPQIPEKLAGEPEYNPEEDEFPF